MATHTISRSFLRRPAKSLSSLFARSFASSSAPLAKNPASSLYALRSRPLVAALSSVARGGLVSFKGLSTQATSSSLNDPNPNWSNRPPKETILLDGCDFEHWLVVVEPPEGDLTRDEIIDGYIKTLAQIVGSEEEARMKIYSVSTRCYFAFGALVSEDLSHKLKELPKVRWVLPDSYLDVRNKDYGGEPFIDGKAVPYDPKYHEEWIRNNARANERNRRLSTQATSSSLNDPNPNWSNRPPKETILLDGCDFEHWLVVVEPPEGDLTRDEIIDGYIKTLAQIVGSEEEARMKIYSVSTRCYFAFGALVSEDLSHKLKELPKVRWVLPDSYLDVRNKDYGGEPFIDGKAVPYDPKYHEEWIRNNARANERNRRNDRPRNFDRSRNFERRRENMSGGPPPQRTPMGGPPPPPHMGGAAPPPPHMGQNYGGPPPPQNNMGGQRPPPNYGGAPPQNNMAGQRPPANYGGAPPPNYGGAPPPNYGGAPPQNNMGGAPPPPNYGGAVPPQNIMGGGPPNAGWSGNNNNYQQQSGGMQQPQYQNNYPPNRDGSGNPYQG
ncbi:hypothetical protein DY000_02004256 [Brassica cretica]|uniref:MORF/ORRM1/DAG-like MORF domain-containing protein n=1 Tax=Brassica cretica TaxID=69181 RepID=A0ABQ7C8K1_BRACR|nr:hypothetical protein DY000_02004256 [Brassica cretica]